VLGLQDFGLLLEQIRSVPEMVEAMGQLGFGLALGTFDMTCQTDITRLDRSRSDTIVFCARSRLA
jgi:hypothetical protein